MRKIVLYPAKILRQKPKEVEIVDKKLLAEIKELTKSLEAGENAAGLAAVQIGYKSKFFGIKTGDEGVVVFVNPKIKKSYGDKVYPKLVGKDGKDEDFLEGCLSFPGYFGTVKRFLKIDVVWQEVKEGKLKEKNKSLSGFEAIVFQHELDHVSGIVFVDHIKEEKGKIFKEIEGKMVLQSKVDF